MKKAKKILLLIGGIIAVFAMLGVIITGIATIAFSTPAFTEALQAAVEDGTFTTNLPDIESLQIYLKIVGIFVLVSSILPLACAIISFMAKDKDSKALYITCIVLGLVTSMYIILIGGIVGLLDADKNEHDRQTEQYQ